VVHEPNLVPGTILVLVVNDPVSSPVQYRIIYGGHVPGTTEGLEYKSGKPQTTYRIAVPECRERTIPVLVGQLTLVPGNDEHLGFGLNLGIGLARCLQVSQYLHVRGEEHHVLLTAAVRHTQQVVHAADGLGHQGRGEGEQYLARIGNNTKG